MLSLQKLLVATKLGGKGGWSKTGGTAPRPGPKTATGDDDNDDTYDDDVTPTGLVARNYY